LIGPGWIGDPEQVLYVLGLAGADRDEEGKFLIYGEPVIAGLTGETLVPAGAEYAVRGHRANLAALLSSTSYGLGITVIS
jgi:hypothetical protein